MTIMKTKIRLAKKTVRLITRLDNGMLRLGGIGSDKEIFDIHENSILNIEDINIDASIDFDAQPVRIVTPERVSLGLFSSITFTREIELPK